MSFFSSIDPLCLNEDLCNGIVPSQASTTAAAATTTTTTTTTTPTPPTKTTTADANAQRRKPATSHFLETDSSTISTIYTTPTTIMQGMENPNLLGLDRSI